MGELQRIAAEFEKLQQGECWIGMNMEKALAGITAEAAQKNHAGSNTIWQLVSHLTYWRKEVISRLDGSDTLQDMTDFFVPEIADDTNWQDTLIHFRDIYHALQKAILDFDEGILHMPSPKKEQTYYGLLVGCLQHDAYHLGQIIILKK